ncbi:3-methyl-2-oxobutanoate hydroxymethyltransferase [Deltaproteobacteria bacterium TL4]
MKKKSIPKFMRAKGQEKLICLTAYDAFQAALLNASEVDLILIGDTLGHVVQGNNSTIPVTLDEIIYHSRIVARNAPDTLVVADMPFGSVGVSVEETMRQCIHTIKQSGVGAVKMEGTSKAILEAIPRLNEIGVPVMGHIGFQPQSVNVYGGNKIDGKTDDDRKRLLDDAQLLMEAGVFSLVLECVIENVAKEITETISIPTIGIGSGRYVDGQILVIHDLLGMTIGKLPSFIRKYADLFEVAKEAVQHWTEDVKNVRYPSEGETYQVK